MRGRLAAERVKDRRAIAGWGCAFIGIPIGLMIPFPLLVSLIYAPYHLSVCRKREPFAGKGGGLYVFLRVAVVLSGFILFLIGGVAPPLAQLCLAYMRSIWKLVAVVEMFLLPFIVSAFIYGGMRLFFRLRRGNMGDYIDYRVILYYVSLTILTAYGLFFAMAVVIAR